MIMKLINFGSIKIATLMLSIGILFCIQTLQAQNDTTVINICKGERLFLGTGDFGAPPVPYTIIGDVGAPDFSISHYVIEQVVNGSYEKVCEPCVYSYVEPETSTLYRMRWNTPTLNDYGQPVSPILAGSSFVLIEVDACSIEVDLSPDPEYKPIEFVEEDVKPISSQWINNGPGYLNTAEFVLEINGEVIDTTTFNGTLFGGGVNVDERFTFVFHNNFIFRPNTGYTIGIRLLSANGVEDLNAANNLIVYTSTPFSPKQDIAIFSIRKPTLPLQDGLSPFEINYGNSGNTIIDAYTINWTVNGELQTPYEVPYPADLRPGNGATIDLSNGGINFNSTSDYKIVSWVELPGNEADINSENNTVEFIYSGKDKAHYQSDKFFVICEEESITLSTSGVYDSVSEGCVSCGVFMENPVWSVDGTVLNNSTEITVNPQSSTFYNIQADSELSCDFLFCNWGPGPIGPQPPLPEYPDVINATYSVIVLDCDFEPAPLNIIDDYTWLNTIVDKNNCNGTTITAYEAGFYDYIYVKTNNGGSLYLNNGTFYCSDSGDSYCVNAYGLNNVKDSFICGSTQNNIEGCTDANATNYNPLATVDDGSCQYNNNNSPIFTKYPWLGSYVNPNNCSGEKITVYNSGFYNFILIENGNLGKLYFENGTYYCDETPEYSCVNAYGLNNVDQTWTCGNSNSISGCTDSNANNYNPAATTDDGSCEYDNNNSAIFTTYPWLSTYVNPNNCNGESITVYNAGYYNFVLIKNGNEGKLYLENGIYYCDETPAYSCVNIYGLNNIESTWTCGNSTTISGCTDSNATNYNPAATADDGSCEYAAADCSNHTGTFFYQNCGGTSYYFIRLADGRVFDPYFADGIAINPLEGQQVNFDYVINTTITTPCTVSESAITITCLEEISGSVFQEYPWLNALVNENNCTSENIIVYDAGGYNFINVQTSTTSSLYYQDGTFYCQDAPGYSCVNAYRLSNVADMWSCGDAGIQADKFYTICPGESVVLNLYEIPSRTCSCGGLDDGLVIPSYTIYVNDELIENNIAPQDFTLTPTTSTTYKFVGRSGITPAGCGCVYTATTFIHIEVDENCGGNQNNKQAGNLTADLSKRIAEPFAFKLYPNPTKAKVFLEAHLSQQEDFTISIFDINGKQIKRQDKIAQQYGADIELDVSGLHKGMYIVEMKTSAQSSIKKLIIE